MNHLWSGGEGEAKSVHRALGKRRGITLNTIQSTLKRLYEKGLLARDKVSHAHFYRARLSRDDVTVYESVAAARGAIPEEPEVPGRIPFLKEQQWPIEFGTAVISERPTRPTLRASGTIRARSDGELRLTAPVASLRASVRSHVWVSASP